ncbi:hypothetical protein thsrh120_61070 [Rhizobium sp. No.120]
MSEKHICWTRRALRPLVEIGAYIQKDNPDAAARILPDVCLHCFVDHVIMAGEQRYLAIGADHKKVLKEHLGIHEQALL